MIENKADMETIGHLTVAVIRVLMAKGLIEKDDIMADLMRQETPAEIAFAVSKLLDSLPSR